LIVIILLIVVVVFLHSELHKNSVNFVCEIYFGNGEDNKIIPLKLLVFLSGYAIVLLSVLNGAAFVAPFDLLIIFISILHQPHFYEVSLLIDRPDKKFFDRFCNMETVNCAYCFFAFSTPRQI